MSVSIPVDDARRRRCTVTIEGLVQGVGFRPFVYRAAVRHGLRGTVRNSLQGAVVEVLTSWPAIARVVRAETLSLARREFVEAARALGAPGWNVLARHILPNALPAALVVISLNAGTVVLMEAGVSFIGLGDPAAMSWGYLASNAQRFLRVAWWLALFPGLAMALAMLGLNLLGDELNDLLDPRLGR